MPKGWLYNWKGMATVGRQIPETRFGKKLAFLLSVRVLTISNRCLEDCSCAHKWLMTNWPHHNPTEQGSRIVRQATKVTKFSSLLLLLGCAFYERVSASSPSLRLSYSLRTASLSAFTVILSTVQ